MAYTIVEDDFKAWIDEMPGTGHTLIVVGKARFPTPGWSATLTEAEPPGINPDILILELVATSPPPGTVVPQVVTTVDVRFEKPQASRYKQVTIRYERTSFTIDVGVVS